LSLLFGILLARNNITFRAVLWISFIHFICSHSRSGRLSTLAISLVHSPASDF
jgi:hypothetical protein